MKQFFNIFNSFNRKNNSSPGLPENTINKNHKKLFQSDQQELVDNLSLFKLNEKNFKQLTTLIDLYGEEAFIKAAQEKIFKLPSHEEIMAKLKIDQGTKLDLSSYVLWNYSSYLNRSDRYYEYEFQDADFLKMLNLLRSLNLFSFIDKQIKKIIINNFYSFAYLEVNNCFDFPDKPDQFNSLHNLAFLAKNNPDCLSLESIRISLSSKNNNFFNETINLFNTLTINDFEQIISGYHLHAATKSSPQESMLNALINKIQGPLERNSFARIIMQWPYLIDKLEPLYLNNKIAKSITSSSSSKNNKL